MTLGLVLAISGCGGGYDDMDAAREGMAGIGSTVTKPSNPDAKPNWQYKSIADGSRVFSLTAINYATNTYQMPEYNNLRGRTWVFIDRTLNSDDTVTDAVTIFTSSSLSCIPSCNVRMSFDGNWATYQMRHSSDGIIKPIDDGVAKTLFKKFTTSNRATVSLPIIGLLEPFDANFDLRGYDMKRMKF